MNIRGILHSPVSIFVNILVISVVLIWVDSHSTKQQNVFGCSFQIPSSYHSVYVDSTKLNPYKRYEKDGATPSGSIEIFPLNVIRKTKNGKYTNVTVKKLYDGIYLKAFLKEIYWKGNSKTTTKVVITNDVQSLVLTRGRSIDWMRFVDQCEKKNSLDGKRIAIFGCFLQFPLSYKKVYVGDKNIIRYEKSIYSVNILGSVEIGFPPFKPVSNDGKDKDGKNPRITIERTYTGNHLDVYVMKIYGRLRKKIIKEMIITDDTESIRITDSKDSGIDWGDFVDRCDKRKT